MSYLGAGGSTGGAIFFPTSDRPEPIPSFIARHPFVFLIRDKLTGGILFMGRVEDPSAG
jgi:serine protease inhibitor